MAAANHAKAVGMMKERASLEQRDGLLAGVDQVIVFFARRRRGAHTQDAVLAVQDDFTTPEVFPDKSGSPEPEVDNRALEYVLRHTRSELIFGASLVSHGHAACLEPTAGLETRSILTIL